MNAASFWWLLVVVAKPIYFVDANWITGNLCWSMPCMNGGSCFGSAYTYLCICPINYSGGLCEKRHGVCQESPCGNRGLCVETSLTSYECRCYFDYMGPTCEELVSKNNRNIWSSLLPVHTRVLFDMLQEAYREKTQGKSSISSENAQIDFLGLLTTNEPLLLPTPATSTIPITSTIVETTFIIDQNNTTKTEYVIRAEDIQLEKIFSDVSTSPDTSNMNTNQITEQNEFNNQTTVPSYDETESISSTIIMDNMTTPIEQTQSISLNITEDQETVNTTEPLSTLAQWSSDNHTIDYTTTQISFEETTNNIQSEEPTVMSTAKSIDFTTSNIDIITDDKKFTSSMTTSEQSSSPDTTTISPNAHSQLLYKLCQQLLSHILPNASSSATAAVLALASNSSSNTNTADALLSWLTKQLSSSTSTTTTTATSIVPSLSISEIRTSSMPLQRVDMNDLLRQMNDNLDNEHQ